jgi:hypothetical protein
MRLSSDFRAQEDEFQSFFVPGLFILRVALADLEVIGVFEHVANDDWIVTTQFFEIIGEVVHFAQADGLAECDHAF